MRCEDVERIVFSGRAATQEESDAMRAHAMQCEACRVLMENADVLSGAREIDVDARVPDSFARGWRAAVRGTPQRRGALWRAAQVMRDRVRSRPAARIAAYACCAAVLLGMGAQMGRMGTISSSSEKKSASVTQTYDLMAEDAQFDSGSMMSRSAGAAASKNTADSGRKIIRTAQISLRVADMDETLDAIRGQARDAGGSVTACDVSGTAEDGRYADVEISIPDDALDAFLAGAKTLGTVTREATWSSDMTGDYQDNASRLQSAQAQKQRLDELYESAQDMQDIVTITDALFEVQREIDELTGVNRSIDEQDENAQVSLTLIETREAEEEDEPFLALLREQGRQGVQSLGNFLSELALFAAWALPWLAALGVVAGVVWGVARRRRR